MSYQKPDNNHAKENSRVSCQKGPTRYASAWQIGPLWQDTLELSNVTHTLNLKPSALAQMETNKTSPVPSRKRSNMFAFYGYSVYALFPSWYQYINARDSHLRHGYVITFHIILWVWLFTHA